MEKLFTLNDIPLVVKEHLVPLLKTHNILTFTGPLGAGKTTIIKELFKQCGFTTVITSPTFAYVNTYQHPQTHQYFHHFDLYRINDIQSFIDAGFDEYIHKPDDIILIEWPEVILPLLNNPKFLNKICFITISYLEKDPAIRKINANP